MDGKARAIPAGMATERWEYRSAPTLNFSSGSKIVPTQDIPRSAHLAYTRIITGQSVRYLERVKGIEPSFSAWEAEILLESNQRIGATERNRTPDLTITNHGNPMDCNEQQQPVQRLIRVS